MDLGCADHNLPGGVAGSTVFGGFCAHIGLVNAVSTDVRAAAQK